jgi:hypothetical protein
MYCVLDIAFDEIVFHGSERECASYASYWNSKKNAARYEVTRAKDYAMVG